MGFGWIAVEKPAGISVHNDPGMDLRSRLATRLDEEPDLARCAGFDRAFGVHPVHRLDRDTSGILLIAVRSETQRALTRQFESGSARKTYLALLHGHPFTPDPVGPWREWAWPLGKDAGGRDHPEGRGPLAPCRTLYRILAVSTHYSLVGIRLVTGRKHQIRRHARMAGHPVVGDRRYGPMRAIRWLARHHDYRTLALHAHGFDFTDPKNSLPMSLRTASFPEPGARLFVEDGGCLDPSVFG